MDCQRFQSGDKLASWCVCAQPVRPRPPQLPSAAEPLCLQVPHSRQRVPAPTVWDSITQEAAGSMSPLPSASTERATACSSKPRDTRRALCEHRSRLSSEAQRDLLSQSRKKAAQGEPSESCWRRLAVRAELWLWISD